MVRPLLITLAVLSVWPAQSTPADDFFWTSPLGGAFDEPSHWTPFTPPGVQGPGDAADTVNFDLGVQAVAPYFVTDASGTNSRLVVHDDSLLFSVFVHYELLNPGGADPSFVVGAASGDDAFISLFGGGVSTLDAQVVRLGDAAGSEGSARVDALRWNTDNFRIGYGGDGTLAVDVDAAIASRNASMAHLAGSTGYAVIQGEWIVSGNLIVGRQGEALLEVSGGGELTANTVVIGDLPAGVGSALVTWTLTSDGALTVGDRGEGTLTIKGVFGEVTNADAYVGRQPGSAGVVEIHAGSQWSTRGRLSLGGDADAGATGGAAHVDVLGGDVIVEEGLVMFSGSTLALNGGSFSTPEITVQPGAQFTFEGGELFIEQFNGNLSNQGGLLATHPTAKTIEVSGEYAQGLDGALSIKIAGPSASDDYDSLIVGNTAFLGGNLQIELVGSFAPEAADQYVIVDAFHLGAGSFDNVANGARLSDTTGRGSFVVNYGPGSPFDPAQVVLSDFQRILSADFDEDGDVDADDLAAWKAGFGIDGGATRSQGDADGDQDVDGADFLAWQNQLGGSAPLRITAIPEPGSLTVAVVLATSYVGLRGRRPPRDGQRAAAQRCH